MPDGSLKEKLRRLQKGFQESGALEPEKEEPKRFQKIFKAMPDDPYDRYLERMRERAQQKREERERIAEMGEFREKSLEEQREAMPIETEEIQPSLSEEESEDLRLRKLMERYKPRGF